MTTTVDIERKRGDTRRITFIVKDSVTGLAVPIAGWSAFLLTVDPKKAPTDNAANVMQVTGALTSDGSDGRISFTPTGTTAIGNFYYDVQATDDNTEKTTIAEGKYKLTQDITKD